MKITTAVLAFGSVFFSLLPFASAANISSSNNWSGYIADNGAPYTAVSGAWVVPSITPTAALAGDATWVGIGGVSSSDLIQSGTEALVENGQVIYQAWYETLPQDSVDIPVSIKPGDSISVSISEENSNSSSWLISFSDNSTGQNYQANLSYTSSLSSAEWVEEMPTVSVGSSTVRDFGLDDFGTVSFSNATAEQNGNQYTIAENGGAPLIMINAKNQILAAPSAIGSDGESFSVSRSDVASNSSLPYKYNPSSGGHSHSLRVGVGIRGLAGRQFLKQKATEQNSKFTQSQSILRFFRKINFHF